MTLTFLYPQAAWLFALVPLLWLPMRRRPRWMHLGLRAAILAVLILALMQPSLIRAHGPGVQVVILDQREALGTQGRQAARRAFDRLAATAQGRLRVIQLGGTRGSDSAAQPPIVTDGSLSTALARALAEIPLATGGAVTVISDGRSTDRHWENSVAALVRRGIPVNSIVVPGPAAAPFLAEVHVGTARVGETLRVEVLVEGKDDATHRLTIDSGGRERAVSQPFAADGAARVVLTVPAEQAGFLPMRVTLDGRSRVETLAAVQPALPLLYVGARQAGGAAMLQQLLGAGFTVTAEHPAALAGQIDPARWPLVVLDDVPAAQLPVEAQRRINRAVSRDGTGLLASGGLSAFGSGGYAGTPLGAALPITARQQEKQIQPSVALAIVIDSSGSMQGERLELAKQIARQTVRKLTPNDWIGVVEFYGARQWSVPMHHATDIPDIERSIGRMQAQGASVLFPALQEALYGLKDVEARYRHILVISDGGVAEDRYQQLIRHIADSRINLSTVAVGGQVDDEKSMAEWARIGRGQFYSVPDEFSLIELDFKQPQTKPQPAYRDGSFAVRAAPEDMGWGGRRVAAAPPLSGYVPVQLRPEAQALLRTAEGDPVLSSWQVGGGRVMALATEPLGAGTTNWRGWPGYGGWLARVLAMTARRDPAFDVTIARRFDWLTVAVQRLGAASAGQERAPTLTLVDEAGRTMRTVAPLEARAPGLFEADFAWPSAQPARVEVRDGDRLVYAADAARSDLAPVDAMPASMALPMAILSQRTGGWHRETPELAPGALPAPTGLAATDLWPWFALLALTLYLAELGYRRWPSRGRPRT